MSRLEWMNTRGRDLWEARTPSGDRVTVEPNEGGSGWVATLHTDGGGIIGIYETAPRAKRAAAQYVGEARHGGNRHG